MNYLIHNAKKEALLKAEQEDKENLESTYKILKKRAEND